MSTMMIIPMTVMAGLGFLLSLVLVFAPHYFFVEEDPVLEAILSVPSPIPRPGRRLCAAFSAVQPAMTNKKTRRKKMAYEDAYTDCSWMKFEVLERFMKDVLVASRIPQKDAAIISDVLITSDKRGIDSHGIGRLKPIYIDRIDAGILNPITKISIVRDRKTSAVLDGHNGMGHVIAKNAMERAIGKARAALTPLNHSLARQMIRQTKISRVLNGFRHIAWVSETQLEELLIRTGRLVTDFPEITDLDINPLMVKDGKIIAVAARIHMAPCKEISPRHLIISSYPWEYESRGRTMDGHDFFVRPIRPDDADMMLEHFNCLSQRSIYMRFFSPLKQLSQQMLIRLIQIDYDRQIALVALMGQDQEEKIIGVSRIIGYFDGSQAEFAVTVIDDWQGQGIGAALLAQCLAAARNQGMKKIMGFVLAENTQMLKLGRKLGFKIKRVEESSEFELTIDL